MSVDSDTSPDGADERVHPVFKEICGWVITVTEKVVPILNVGLSSPVFSDDMDVLGGPGCR